LRSVGRKEAVTNRKWLRLGFLVALWFVVVAACPSDTVPCGVVSVTKTCCPKYEPVCCSDGTHYWCASSLDKC
jgi:hypothetical protein